MNIQVILMRTRYLNVGDNEIEWMSWMRACSFPVFDGFGGYLSVNWLNAKITDAKNIVYQRL